MKIALVGYGRMGREVERIAAQKGFDIVTRIDPQNPEADSKILSKEALSDADVCIEFSHPDSVLKNLEILLDFDVPVVTGTTGWFKHLPEIRQKVNSLKGGLVYASNFSLGMNLFFKMCETAATMMNAFPEYDVAGFELHHRGKADAPSGTAKILSQILLDQVDRKKKNVFHPGNRKIDDDELHFASVRVGAVPGTHQILFDSNADSISLTHTARNREGFAAGAIKAAEWIIGKTGCFSFQDIIEDFLS